MAEQADTRLTERPDFVQPRSAGSAPVEASDLDSGSPASIWPSIVLATGTFSIMTSVMALVLTAIGFRLGIIPGLLSLVLGAFTFATGSFWLRRARLREFDSQWRVLLLLGWLSGLLSTVVGGFVAFLALSLLLL